MHVRLSINEQGALHNQQYAFSDRYTLVTELLQNARRAGAERICVAYDDENHILVVEDDGIGIADFQKLFSLHESGWDAITVEHERPFGVGFSKCLFASRRCLVESRDAKVDFLTQDALNQEPIAVLPNDFRRGTRVSLFDVDLPELDTRIESLCRGFAVPVSYQGRVLSRPHALDAHSFHATSIGWVRLAGVSNGSATIGTAVYLLGFCVLEPRPSFIYGPVNVVHLDPTRFTARLPDRDKLIDEAEQQAVIDTTLRAFWRQTLLEKKRELSPEAFADRYFDAARLWNHLDVFDDVPVLPRGVCEQIVGYPYQEGYEDADYLKPLSRSVTRAEIESGALRIAELDAPNGNNATRWMYARGKGMLLFSGFLGPNHWLYAHLIDLNDVAVTVELEGDRLTSEFHGRWCHETLVLCEAYSIAVAEDRVRIENDGLFHCGQLIIPRGERSGVACRQAYSYIDESDRFCDDDWEADEFALAQLIGHLRARDAKATLHALIEELHLERYPVLQGKSFQLVIGANDTENRVGLNE